MKRLLLVASAVLTTASAPAAAQEQVHLTLSWLEVTTGTNTPITNPNGVLEPGESARISVTALVTPPIGSPVTYVPPPLPGAGTLAGLGSIIIDLAAGNQSYPSPSGAGSWSGIARAPGWALGGSGDVQAAGNRILNIQAGQFVALGMTANSSNPVSDIWHGVWTPWSYASRAEAWNLYPGITEYYPLVILIRYGTDPAGHPLYVGKGVPGTYGSTTIPIVPAPASLLAVFALFLQRRRCGP